MPPNVQLFTFVCANCHKKLEIQGTDEEQTRMNSSAVMGWMFDVGTNTPVCCGKCAAAYNKSRGIGLEAAN